MKTIEVTLYKFNELSADAQQKAIDHNREINLDYDWWESIYDDAENIGLKITGFDISSYCTGNFINSAIYTAKEIISEHGEQCETYKTAKTFLAECESINQKAIAEGKEGDEDYWFSDEIEDAEKDFKQSLLEDYRIILQKEYEYQSSDEAVKDMIAMNDYDFTEDGDEY